jgi:uncharacterized protein HemX
MAALTTIAVVAGLAISAAATGYGVNEQRQAARESKDAARDEKGAQKKLEEEAALKDQQERRMAAQRASDTRSRLTLLQGGGNQSGNIRTSELGSTVDQGNYARKVATGL